MAAKNSQIIVAGFIGLLAAILVGTGEFLLHFDSLGRFDEAGGYDFMKGISAHASSTGHFVAVLGAPLYLVGFWHLMKMLEPANKMASRIAFVIMSYGIMVGSVWIGSRASISAIVNLETLSDLSHLVSLYEFRYENILQITRLAVLLFSIIFIWLCLSGRSYYPRWFAVFNPILILLSCFAIWLIKPAIGIYLMPIALNVSFGLLFLVSIFYSFTISKQQKD